MYVILLYLCILAVSAVNGLQSYCAPQYRPKSGVAYELDLSRLDTDFEIEQNSDTHPSKTSIRTKINICKSLDGMGVNDEQCDQGAYICRRVIYLKGNNQYVAVVQNIAGEFKGSNLNPVFKLLGTDDDLSKSGTQYSLTLNGGNEHGEAQSASIMLTCDSSKDRNAAPTPPEIVSYQNNVLSLTWKTPHACALKPGDDGNTADSSSTLTLFKVLLVMAGIYFIGGALYNFKQYNARGLDLIPHRDFWLDLPYIIRDLVANCVDSVMSRRRGGSGSGYVAV
ncbi:autophagy-related protein 27 [Absidia repens]|uniref:Autophagy-related protein 27 n=1 Tax=Absidia repens TaxID=90262 RepID=A0A1X2HK68_9FUNG|nr:autophagy-related protein 27 [Absidia repens]